MFAFVSAPADTHLPSHCAPTHPSQYREQPNRSRGRLRARRHPQGDADHHPGVSHRPRVFAFVSAPVDTCLVSHRPLPACSLGGNALTNYGNDMSGLLKLVEILPLTKIESLGCAAASKCSLLCQRPLTRLLSHHSRSAPCLQSPLERDRRRERLRARCCPKGDANHRPAVRRHPIVFAFMSAPIDSPQHLPCSQSLGKQTRL